MKNCLVPERLAARFTRANSEYLSRANHANFSGHVNGWWIALWFYADVLPSVVGDHLSLWDSANGGVNDGCLLYAHSANDKVYCYAYGAVSDSLSLTSNVAITAGKWHFLYTDYDGVNLRQQLDDNAIQSVGYTDYVAATGTLNLGRRGNNSMYHGGRLQCVMCGHPNILTAAEIAWLYSEVPKWNGISQSGNQTVDRESALYRFLRGSGYGDGVGIPAKATAGWPLQEEGNGSQGAVPRYECWGLTLTDNNTVDSVRGLQP